MDIKFKKVFWKNIPFRLDVIYASDRGVLQLVGSVQGLDAIEGYCQINDAVSERASRTKNENLSRL